VVTAKEDLRDLVAELSEAEAARWLRRMARQTPILTTAAEAAARPILSGETNLAALAELLAQWREEGPSVSDEEWEKFAREFDAGRPHRPLFT
jgi:DNA-binding IclR family transcriptional regulator